MQETRHHPPRPPRSPWWVKTSSTPEIWTRRGTAAPSEGREGKLERDGRPERGGPRIAAPPGPTGKPSREASRENGLIRSGVVIFHALAPSRPPLDHMGPQIYQSRLPVAFLTKYRSWAIICFYNCKEGAGSPFPSRAIELCSAFCVYLTQRQRRLHLALPVVAQTKAVLSVKLGDSLTARQDGPSAPLGLEELLRRPLGQEARSQSGGPDTTTCNFRTLELAW